jgi:AcrR family transcriptional regulator
MLGRPRTISDQEILTAAARAISRVGPARLTLADVATEAGIAPATVLQRFGSKKGLLLAFSATASIGVSGAFAAARSAHRSPIATLLADPLGISDVMRSPDELAHHLAFLQLELVDPDFHPHVVAHARATRREIRRLLDEAIRTGELIQCDTSRLAAAVHVTYNGALLSWAIFRRGSLATALRRNIEFVLNPYVQPNRAPRPRQTAR